MAQSITISLLLTILALTSAKSVQGGRGYGIIGGEVANITELPHTVQVIWVHMCGGSIISSQHILTKASCVDTSTSAFSRVTAAEDDKNPHGVWYPILKGTTNDKGGIAVIKLTKEIILSDKAQPIALAGPKYKIKDGAVLIASGWGKYEISDRSSKLRKVTISKVSDAECKDAFPNFNSSEQFCAGGKGKKACFWDQGGPLIEKTSKGNILVGVIESIEYCNNDDIQKPSLFTRVSTFNKWIQEVVKEDLDSDE